MDWLTWSFVLFVLMALHVDVALRRWLGRVARLHGEVAVRHHCEQGERKAHLRRRRQRTGGARPTFTT